MRLNPLARSDMNNLKITTLINAYCAVNIPLLAFITPRVVELNDSRAVVRVRLDRRSRNHLGVMYFGALAMGSELSIALKALTAIHGSGKKIDFIAQEMQRETNTIGSKLQDKVVSNAVIALKSKIEKIREQSQNIE